MPPEPFSKEVVNWLTAGAIFVGGIWALWRWGFSEWLRRRAEILTLDGAMSVELIKINAEKVLAFVCATWRNTGIVPVYVNTDKSCFEIYEISNSTQGYIDVDQIDDKFIKAKVFPLKDLKPFFFEPNTISLLTASFVLPKDKVYISRAMVFADMQHHKTKFAWRWSRQKPFASSIKELIA